MAVYFFYGEDEFNIDEELNQMRSKLNPDFMSMSYQSLDNPDFTDMITALRSSPMMFGSSLIVIDIKNYFLSDDYNFDDKQSDEIEYALENNQDGIDVVFVVRIPFGSEKKLDSRRKLYKILSKFNKKEFKPFTSFETDKISAWIKERAKVKKLKIADDAVKVLIEQIGTNLMQFDGELEKLKLAAHPDNMITKKMVEDNCINNQNLFNITKYLMSGDKGKALLEYKKLTETKYPLEILIALQTMIRQWVIVKAKSSSSDADIMKLSGIKNGGKIYYLKKDLKNVSLKDLVKLKENLFDVEYRIKSGQVTDIETEVELAIIG